MLTHPIIAQVVNRQHVGKSNRQIIAAVYRSFNDKGRTSEFREQRKAWYIQAIKLHNENRKLYYRVTRGKF